MITFSHPQVGSVTLRFLTRVNWTYNLNYSKQDTYGGQVIQLLSINYDKLILEGRFGKEGAHGKTIQGNTLVDRKDYWAYAVQGKYATGLSQLTAFFQDYFAAASQGGDRRLGFTGNFNQIPMTVTYRGALNNQSFMQGGEASWTGYPVDFPSYSRSLEEFAPEWHVELEIEEADYEINNSSLQQELDRLREGVGFTPYWKYSDPLGKFLTGENLTKTQIQNAEKAYNQSVNTSIDQFSEFLPAYNPSDLLSMLINGSSIPDIGRTLTHVPDNATTSNKTSPTTSPNNGVTVDPTKPQAPPAHTSVPPKTTTQTPPPGAPSQSNPPPNNPFAAWDPSQKHWIDTRTGRQIPGY